MDLLINILIKLEIYFIFLIALNLLMVGKMNLWAIGNIVYFSIGAFAAGFFEDKLLSGYYQYLLFIIVPIIAFGISVIFQIISYILKQDFFLFFSLFFIEFNYVFNNQLAGPSGYSHIQRPPGLQSDQSLFLVLFFMSILLVFWMILFGKSKVNNIHTIIRTNETLAKSFGIDVFRVQRPLFYSSAIISSIAGIFFAIYSFGADPQIFKTNEIIILFVLVIFSGIDSIKGTFIAALLYVFLTFFLDSVLSDNLEIIAPKISQIIFGILLIIVPFFLPKGLFGKRSI